MEMGIEQHKVTQIVQKIMQNTHKLSTLDGEIMKKTKKACILKKLEVL